MKDPETSLRELWTRQGVPQPRQDAIIAEVTAKAQPGQRVGPFIVGATPAELRAERDQYERNKEARERRLDLKDAAARRLRAGPLDTTGDLFDAYQAENPLFATPTPGNQ